MALPKIPRNEWWVVYWDNVSGNAWMSPIHLLSPSMKRINLQPLGSSILIISRISLICSRGWTVENTFKIQSEWMREWVYQKNRDQNSIGISFENISFSVNSHRSPSMSIKLHSFSTNQWLRMCVLFLFPSLRQRAYRWMVFIGPKIEKERHWYSLSVLRISPRTHLLHYQGLRGEFGFTDKGILRSGCRTEWWSSFKGVCSRRLSHCGLGSRGSGSRALTERGWEHLVIHVDDWGEEEVDIIGWTDAEIVDDSGLFGKGGGRGIADKSGHFEEFTADFQSVAQFE